MLKPVARRFYNNTMMDVWPQFAAERTDFGFRSDADQMRLFVAYRDGIRNGKISEQQLSDACCNGPALTELVQTVDPTLVVQTDWDDIAAENDKFLDEPLGSGEYASGDC